MNNQIFNLSLLFFRIEFKIKTMELQSGLATRSLLTNQDESGQLIKVYVVMGVCGCGKSTLGKQLAHHYNGVFIEADEFHSEANKRLMREGIPLNDENRLPWLKALAAEVVKSIEQIKANKKFNSKTKQIFLACSALKRSYRNLLRQQVQLSQQGTLVLLYLHIPCLQDLMRRVSERKGHFINSTLVESQLKTLEIPDYSEQPNIRLDVLSQNSDETLAAAIKIIDEMNK